MLGLILPSYYKYGVILVVCSALAFTALTWHKMKVQEAVQVATTALNESWRVSTEEQRKHLTGLSDKAQGALQSKLNSTQRSKQDEVKKLQSTLTTLRSSLHERPDRTPDSASNSTNPTSETGSPKGATGLQLSKLDAEFLAGYASLASELQIELKACVTDYENTRNDLLEYVNASQERKSP